MLKDIAPKTIDVDRMEPKQLQQAFGWFGNAPTLRYGDFSWINNDGALVGGQRKTVSDLASSIRSGRIWHDVRDLMYNFDYAFILREGWQRILDNRQLEIDGHKQPGDMNFERLDNTLLEIQEYGIKLVLSQSLRWTPQRIACLYDYFNDAERKGITRIVKQDIPFLLNDRDYNCVVAALMCIPTIGQETAITLLNTLGSYGRIKDASTEELLSIKGIGKKTIEHIHRFFNKEFPKWEDIIY